MAGTYWLTILPDTSRLGKGVKEAGDKIVVEPKVQPKVDKGAADKAGQEAGSTVAEGMKKAAKRIGGVLGPVIGPAARELGNKVGQDVADGILTGDLRGAARKVGQDVTETLGDTLEAGKRTIGSILGGLFSGAKPNISHALSSAVTAAVPGLTASLSSASSGPIAKFGEQMATGLSNALRSGQGAVSTFVGGINDAVGNASAGVGSLKQLIGDDSWASPGLDAFQSALTSVNPLVQGLGSVSQLAAAGTTALSGVTKAATVVQWLWNAALTANPLGLVVAGIAAVVAGLTLFFTKTELGRQIWETTWTAIKTAFTVTWDVIKTGLSAGWDFIKGIFDKIGVGFNGLKTGMLTAANAIKDGIKAAFSGLAAIIKAPLHALGALLAGIPESIFGISIPGAGAIKSWGQTLRSLQSGGLIAGPGSGTSDSIVARVSNGEYIVNAAATRRNLPLLEAINSRFETGGLVGDPRGQVSSLIGAPYVMGGFSAAGIDCSGLVSGVVNAYTGRPMFSSRMATPNEGSWLAARGAQPGRGGMGDLTILWWDGGTGGGVNGHTEAILPDGSVIEAGGSHGNVAVGAGTTPPGDPQWKQAMHFPREMLLAAQNPQLPVIGGDGSALGSLGSAQPGTGGGIGGLGGTGGGGGGGRSGGGGSRRIGGAGGGSDKAVSTLEQLGDMLQSGGKEIGGVGDLFQDPMQWPTVKSGMAGLEFLLNLAKNNSSSSSPQGITPRMMPGDLNPVNPGSSLPGGGSAIAGLKGVLPKPGGGQGDTTIDQSIHTGDIGTDQNAQSAMSSVRNMMTDRTRSTVRVG